MADYNKVIEEAPQGSRNRSTAYYNRGNSKFDLGDKAGACADWHKALELGSQRAGERIAEHCRP